MYVMICDQYNFEDLLLCDGRLVTCSSCHPCCNCMKILTHSLVSSTPRSQLTRHAAVACAPAAAAQPGLKLRLTAATKICAVKVAASGQDRTLHMSESKQLPSCLCAGFTVGPCACFSQSACVLYPTPEGSCSSKLSSIWLTSRSIPCVILHVLFF